MKIYTIFFLTLNLSGIVYSQNKDTFLLEYKNFNLSNFETDNNILNILNECPKYKNLPFFTNPQNFSINALAVYKYFENNNSCLLEQTDSIFQFLIHQPVINSTNSVINKYVFYTNTYYGTFFNDVKIYYLDTILNSQYKTYVFIGLYNIKSNSTFVITEMYKIILVNTKYNKIKSIVIPAYFVQNDYNAMNNFSKQNKTFHEHYTNITQKIEVGHTLFRYKDSTYSYCQYYMKNNQLFKYDTDKCVSQINNIHFMINKDGYVEILPDKKHKLKK